MFDRINLINPLHVKGRGKWLSIFIHITRWKLSWAYEGKHIINLGNSSHSQFISKNMTNDIFGLHQMNHTQKIYSWRQPNPHWSINYKLNFCPSISGQIFFLFRWNCKTPQALIYLLGNKAMFGLKVFYSRQEQKIWRSGYLQLLNAVSLSFSPTAFLLLGSFARCALDAPFEF